MTEVWPTARLARSRDYTEVAAALHHYAETCPSEAKPEYERAQQHLAGLLGSAKEDLVAAAQFPHPAEIDAVLVRYEQYGKDLTTELAGVKERRNQLINEANKALSDVAVDSNATLQSMEEVLVKYDGYPAADIRKGRDFVKTKQAVLSTTVRDRLNTATKTDDLKQIEEVLAEYKDTGEMVRSAYTALTSHANSLRDEMRRKLGAAISVGDPRQIIELLEQAEAYGEPLQREREFLKVNMDYPRKRWA